MEICFTILRFALFGPRYPPTITGEYTVAKDSLNPLPSIKYPIKPRNSYCSPIRFDIEYFLSFDIMSISFYLLSPSVFSIEVGECCRNFLQGQKTSFIAIGILIFWHSRFSDHLALGSVTNNIYIRN